jgi:hypothetical protein
LVAIGRDQTLPSSGSKWGITSARMTTLYSGEIPLEQVRAAFFKQSKTDTKNVVLENLENEAAA